LLHLAATYPCKVTKVLRAVELTPQNAVIIRDDIEASHPVQPLWGMLTDAQITLKGRHATLGKSSKAREAEIVSPEDAVFDTVSTTPSHEGAKSEYRHSKACRAPRKQGDQRAH
jgi:hypothetical protein